MRMGRLWRRMRFFAAGIVSVRSRFMNKLYAVMRLTRIEHSAMLAVAVIAAEALAGALRLQGLHTLYIVLLSLLTPVLISMGSFAINDYYDVEADRLNRRSRPLTTGSLARGDALLIAAICLGAGAASAAAINLRAFAIAVLFASMAFLYSYKAKEMLLVGNAFIAISMAIPFIYGDFVFSTTLLPSVAYIALMIFVAGIAREIHGMMRDYKGELKARRARSIVRLIGADGSAALSLALYCAAITISIILFFYTRPFAHNMLYIVPIAAADAMLAYVGVMLLIKRTARAFDTGRNLSLLAMALALLAVLLSALFSIGV